MDCKSVLIEMVGKTGQSPEENHRRWSSFYESMPHPHHSIWHGVESTQQGKIDFGPAIHFIPPNSNAPGGFEPGSPAWQADAVTTRPPDPRKKKKYIYLSILPHDSFWIGNTTSYFAAECEPDEDNDDSEGHDNDALGDMWNVLSLRLLKAFLSGRHLAVWNHTCAKRQN